MSSFTISPTTAKIATVGLVLTLTGTSTTWSGTPFSLVSAKAATIASQSVSTTTYATVHVNTGGEAGMIGITDGTSTTYFVLEPLGQTSVFSDNFIRSNTSFGSPGNGWIDNYGAVWRILSNQLVSNAVNNQYNWRVIRPFSEAWVNGSVRVHFGPNWSGTTKQVCVFGRMQSDSSNTAEAVMAVVQPGATYAAGCNLLTVSNGSTGANPLLPADTNTDTCPTEGWLELVLNGGTCTLHVYATDGVTLLNTRTYTGLTGDYLLTGTQAISAYVGPQYISEYDSYIAATISTSPTSFNAGSTQTFAVTGTNTAFSGAPFAISGVAGCTITAQSTTDATHGSVTIQSTGFLAGTITLTDTISGATVPINVIGASISITPSTYRGNGQVTLSIVGTRTNFVGTTFSVTGTPSVSIIAQQVTDATHATIILSVGSYCGWLTITDNTSGVTKTFEVFHPYKGTLKIGFIGDSITHGYGSLGATAVDSENAYLTALGYNVTTVNRGIDGTTTYDWTGSDLTNAITAFNSAGVKYVQIMLGTNDVHSPFNYSVAYHLQNMTYIVNTLVSSGFIVIINQPIWTVVPNNFNIYPFTANTYYQSYYNADLSLVNGTTVLAGDTQGLNYFQSNPSMLADSVHPTAPGYVTLGELWSNAVLNAIGPSRNLLGQLVEYPGVS